MKPLSIQFDPRLTCDMQRVVDDLTPDQALQLAGVALRSCWRAFVYAGPNDLAALHPEHSEAKALHQFSVMLLGIRAMAAAVDHQAAGELSADEPTMLAVTLTHPLEGEIDIAATQPTPAG